MLPYRTNKGAPPARSSQTKAWAWLFSLLWLWAGLSILAVLLALWMFPITNAFNPFDVPAGRMFGGWGFEGIVAIPYRMAMVLPAVLGILTLAALASALRVYRRRAALALLGHVSSAIRLRAPLPPYLQAAAQGESGGLRRRLWDMADTLASGQTLGFALRTHAGELPPLLIDRVAAAEKSLAMDDSLVRLIERERVRMVGPNLAGMGWTYVLILSAVMTYIVCIVMVFVVPKYAQIFSDFHLKLPPVTQSLIDLARGDTVIFDGINSGAFVVIALMVVLPLVVASTLSRSTRGLFYSVPPARWFANFFDRIAWRIPLLGRLIRHQQTALACDTLAEALQAGQPMPIAINTAILPSMNAVLRRRLALWRTAVENGQPAATSAREAKLPSLLCDLLAGAAASSGGDTAGAVRFAGRAYGAASNRLAAIIGAVAPVATTLVMGMCVAYIALSLMMPMFTLIQGMTGGIGRW